MNIHYFGKQDAPSVIVQAVDERSLPSIEKETDLLRKEVCRTFCLMAITVDDWFCDLSPWKAPAVFGNNSFGDGAAHTLDFILDLCRDPDRNYYLGGYSLSGLFALWAAYQTDLFKGVAAASPSIWFPDFTNYMENHDIGCNSVYLSLGDREAKTKNKIMATVDECIKKARELLVSREINCLLEFNPGNHFTDVEKRCSRAFAWILENSKEV